MRAMRAMKAIVQVRYGSPDGLELREIERPTIEEGQVLVRVKAASVNAADWHLMHRLPQLMSRMMGMKPTRVRGSDLAGCVEAVGAGVERFQVGDEVFGAGRGSFAEYAASPQDRLAPLPAGLTFEQAATFPVAGCTALQGLRDVGQVTAGERVLVYGAGGGVGTFAVQIAKALGAHVTAASRAANLDLLRSLGADEVFDYEREDFTRRGERYDLILDLGSDYSFAEASRALTTAGRIVGVGAPRNMALAFWHLIVAQLRRGDPRERTFLARIRLEDLMTLKEMAENGQLRPVFDRQVPLAEVPAAIAHVGTRAARGKVVIRVDEASAPH